ncbi:MAG: MarR family transcriptional regulator [Planctomycetota bacterium]|nr:MarR family transcriptional regulator [Planctomycetota bacterium]MDA1214421.1 MarR family transcriptional regulator [Planctomycetota bacterium]
MLEYDFENSIGYFLYAATQCVRQSMNAELAREQITFRQWEVLFSMALLQEPSQTELANLLAIEAPTLAGILTRMERDGWLERVSCNVDRRKKRLRATAKSQAVFEQMVECCKNVRQRMLVDIPEEDLQTVKKTCIKICQNLGGKDPSTQLMSNQQAASSDRDQPIVTEATAKEIVTAS